MTFHQKASSGLARGYGHANDLITRLLDGERINPLRPKEGQMLIPTTDLERFIGSLCF